MQALNGPLSPRERELVQLLAEDVAPRGCGARMHITSSTVKYYLASIRTKLRCETNAGAVAIWVRSEGKV